MFKGLLDMTKEFEETGTVDMKPKIPEKKGKIGIVKINVRD